MQLSALQEALFQAAQNGSILFFKEKNGEIMDVIACKKGKLEEWAQNRKGYKCYNSFIFGRDPKKVAEKLNSLAQFLEWEHTTSDQLRQDAVGSLQVLATRLSKGGKVGDACLHLLIEKIRVGNAVQAEPNVDQVGLHQEAGDGIQVQVVVVPEERYMQHNEDLTHLRLLGRQSDEDKQTRLYKNGNANQVMEDEDEGPRNIAELERSFWVDYWDEIQEHCRIQLDGQVVLDPEFVRRAKDSLKNLMPVMNVADVRIKAQQLLLPFKKKSKYYRELQSALFVEFPLLRIYQWNIPGGVFNGNESLENFEGSVRGLADAENKRLEQQNARNRTEYEAFIKKLGLDAAGIDWDQRILPDFSHDSAIQDRSILEAVCRKLHNAYPLLKERLTVEMLSGRTAQQINRFIAHEYIRMMRDLFRLKVSQNEQSQTYNQRVSDLTSNPTKKAKVQKEHCQYLSEQYEQNDRDIEAAVTPEVWRGITCTGEEPLVAHRKSFSQFPSSHNLPVDNTPTTSPQLTIQENYFR